MIWRGGQNSCTKAGKSWQIKAVPITNQIEREVEARARDAGAGGAACGAAVATDGFGLFALRRRRR